MIDVKSIVCMIATNTEVAKPFANRFVHDDINMISNLGDEELAELNEAVSLDSADQIEDELGDVLFSIVNLARHLKVDPELALTRANHKFEARFREMEQSLQAAGVSLADMSIDELESAWQEAKGRLANSA